MVPYSLRLVHAEAAFFSSNPNHSILRAHKLEADTQSVVEMVEKEHPNTPDLTIWQERLHTVKALRARLLFKLKVLKSFKFYNVISGVWKSNDRI